MVLRFLVRPVLAALAAATVAGCGAMEDSARFENLARVVADVPVSLERPGQDAPRTSSEIGLRKAEPVRVQVMDPHDLWDARDGVTKAVVQAAAPMVAEAAVQEVKRRAPDLRAAGLPARSGGTRVIQLGAFSSRAGAESAWAGFKREAALSGLAPRYEPVTVGGRDLVRLRVAAPASSAAAVCAAARVDGPGCARGT